MNCFMVLDPPRSGTGVVSDEKGRPQPGYCAFSRSKVQQKEASKAGRRSGRTLPGRRPCPTASGGTRSAARRDPKAGRAMPRRQFSPQELHNVRELAARWGKIVARHAFGDHGPGLDVGLDAMEQLVAAAAG